mmetsp:Transcript_9739/g.15076  ORF Transcript_9739/g.15076 Transcript_9739/m.15076 type:complete len:94 (-) Transcript_9739:104-385(-)
MGSSVKAAAAAAAAIDDFWREGVPWNVPFCSMFQVMKARVNVGENESINQLCKKRAPTTIEIVVGSVVVLFCFVFCVVVVRFFSHTLIGQVLA